jgi:hypothetical protein
MIRVGKHEFKTYSEAKEFTKNVFNKYNVGETVSEEDKEFFISGIKLREYRCDDKIGCGIKRIFVDKNKYGGKTAMLERIDGTQTDFGIYKHLERKTNKLIQTDKEVDFRKACRTAIVADKKKLKFETNSYGDVHHEEKEFSELVTQFISKYNIDVEITKFIGHKDGDIEICFIDKDLEKLWIDFHGTNSKLEVLSKEDHKLKHKSIN